jgi:hypothetical protein
VAIACLAALVLLGGLTAAAWYLIQLPPDRSGKAPEVVASGKPDAPKASPAKVVVPEKAPEEPLAWSFSPPTPEPRQEAKAKPREKPAAEEKDAPCETYGTSVKFAPSQAQAAREARKGKKLLFVMHISGNFEDAKFT